MSRRRLFQFMNEDPLVGNQQPPGMQKVEVHTPYKGSWSGNNNLGIEQPYQPDVNGRQTILKMPEWGPPCVWTVSLGLRYDETNSPLNSSFEAKAIIEFGAGGTTQLIEVDWQDGAAVPLVFNAVNVIAEFLGAPANVPLDLYLSVMIGRYNSCCYPPTLALAASCLPPATTPLIRVPPFGRRVSVLPARTADAANVYVAGNTLVFYADRSAGLPVGSLRGLDILAYPQGVPVPHFARYVALICAAGPPSIGVRFIFHLEQ